MIIAAHHSSVMGLSTMSLDLSPILDAIETTSTRSLNSVLSLCEVLGVKFTFEHARAC